MAGLKGICVARGGGGGGDDAWGAVTADSFSRRGLRGPGREVAASRQ